MAEQQSSPGLFEIMGENGGLLHGKHADRKKTIKPPFWSVDYYPQFKILPRQQIVRLLLDRDVGCAHGVVCEESCDISNYPAPNDIRMDMLRQMHELFQRHRAAVKGELALLTEQNRIGNRSLKVMALHALQKTGFAKRAADWMISRDLQSIERELQYFTETRLVLNALERALAPYKGKKGRDEDVLQLLSQCVGECRQIETLLRGKLEQRRKMFGIVETGSHISKAA